MPMARWKMFDELIKKHECIYMIYGCGLALIEMDEYDKEYDLIVIVENGTPETEKEEIYSFLEEHDKVWLNTHRLVIDIDDFADNIDIARPSDTDNKYDRFVKAYHFKKYPVYRKSFP